MMPNKLAALGWLVVLLFLISSCSDTFANSGNDSSNIDDMGPGDMTVDLTVMDMRAMDMAAVDMAAIDMNMSTDADADTALGDAEMDMLDDASDASLSDTNPDDLPDTCLTAEPILLNGANFGTVSGRFAGHKDANTLSSFCAATQPGVDVFFSFEVPAGTWDIQIDTIGSTSDTALSVSFDCQSFGQAVCSNGLDQNQVAAGRVWLHRLATNQPLVVFIAVEDASGSGGDYVANVQLDRAAMDQCLASTSQPLDITGGGTVLGFMTGFVGESTGTCVGSMGPEAVFRADTTNTTTMALSAISAFFLPAIYVRSGICTTGSELGCATGTNNGNVGEALLNVSPGAQGQHFVFVEGNGQGSYVLSYSPF